MRAIAIRGGSVLDERWCNEAEHGRQDGVRTRAAVEMNLVALSRSARVGHNQSIASVGFGLYTIHAPTQLDLRGG